MALTLYTNPMSRGRMARWMLEEVGEPYEARILDYGPMMKAPEYRAINPMGKVPALVHDGIVVTEVPAILSYLAESFPQAGLMPEDRAGFYRWMFFGAGPLEYSVANASMGFEVPRDRRGMMGYGCLEDVVATLAAHLEGRSYFCGDRFSVVDVYVGSQIGFGLRFGTLPSEPALAAYWEGIKDRPAAVKAAEIDDRLLAEKKAEHA
ncbi:glutathione S-transferase family protein [Rubellimicrobium arenae]|uniref:glutathione S-transferase family protein n=1 Tax=Rubellimicrobium arenae TaxID=2817372 RepID=UPI001B309EAE|nr:glutathione S-transferase family protein [Rubellimicrobium arenae]